MFIAALIVLVCAIVSAALIAGLGDMNIGTGIVAAIVAWGGAIASGVLCVVGIVQLIVKHV